MENNGKGIFYGVIGVATLIVAIIGATFAFFTATATNNETIKGNAATVSLGLSVEKVSHGEKGLVPQLETALSSAMKGVDGAGTGKDSCVDANGNTVCQVYKITVTNSGTGDAKLNGTLALEKGDVANLKWATVTGWGTNPVAQGAKGDNNIDTNVTVTGGGNKEYYVVIWIEELTTPQDDTGNFTGTVTFNAADGQGVTSTFTV